MAWGSGEWIRLDQVGLLGLSFLKATSQDGQHADWNEKRLSMSWQGFPGLFSPSTRKHYWFGTT